MATSKKAFHQKFVKKSKNFTQFVKQEVHILFGN